MFFCSFSRHSYHRRGKGKSLAQHRLAGFLPLPPSVLDADALLRDTASDSGGHLFRICFFQTAPLFGQQLSAGHD
jgi:hypothetical protein